MNDQATTVILPYYSQPAMLRVQLYNWFVGYDKDTLRGLRLLIVDDGSPSPAVDHIEPYRSVFQEYGAELWRIHNDIEWNRGEARNIGAHEAMTQWIVHMDIDHLLPPLSAKHLVAWRNRKEQPHPLDWFRFPRYRFGSADDTRNKDLIPRDKKYGKIKPHIDSYLCSKTLYWTVNGYDLDYSGCLGGGSPFLAQMTAVRRPQILPDNIFLHVYTRDSCEDSSVALNRDTSEYSRRRRLKEQQNKTRSVNPIRSDYGRIL